MPVLQKAASECDRRRESVNAKLVYITRHIDVDF